MFKHDVTYDEDEDSDTKNDNIDETEKTLNNPSQASEILLYQGCTVVVVNCENIFRSDKSLKANLKLKHGLLNLVLLRALGKTDIFVY